VSRSGITTIQLDRSVVDELKKFKRYQRETYSEIILNLIESVRENGEFETFVQKAQEERMKELWGEGGYSGWEHA
jgi:predicted CopG family antitoxin